MRRCRVALILAGLAVGVGSESASYEAGELDTAMADLAAGWALLGCGLVAWNRRPESRVGALMAAAGIAWFLGGFLPAALYLHRGPLVHLLLSYPSGRLTRRGDRVVVAASYVDGAIEPLARSPVATLILCGAIVIATCDSYLRASGPRRRARLVPSVGAAGVVLVLGFGALARLAGLDAAEPTLLAYEAVLTAIAGGLLADRLRGRWSQSAVTGLVVDLGGLSEPISLRDRIARALGDPSLQLGYWLGDRYVDERGRPFSLPGPAAGRAVTPVASEGERVAVLVHDAAAAVPEPQDSRDPHPPDLPEARAQRITRLPPPGAGRAGVPPRPITPPARPVSRPAVIVTHMCCAETRRDCRQRRVLPSRTPLHTLALARAV